MVSGNDDADGDGREERWADGEREAVAIGWAWAWAWVGRETIIIKGQTGQGRVATRPRARGAWEQKQPLSLNGV